MQLEDRSSLPPIRVRQQRRVLLTIDFHLFHAADTSRGEAGSKVRRKPIKLETTMAAGRLLRSRRQPAGELSPKSLVAEHFRVDNVSELRVRFAIEFKGRFPLRRHIDKHV
jgi:hypothetical protein